MGETTQHKLNERIKELTGLHRTARILQQAHRPLDELMVEVVELLPEAWQYTSVTVARIVFGERSWQGVNFRETRWMQSEAFAVHGVDCRLDLAYLEEKPAADEGPFLREERELIASLAEMLRRHFEHVLADDALRAAHDDLERQVADRTADLRRLSAELGLAEARERRRIAEALHDHVGQALAVIKHRVTRFRGDSVFCGFEKNLDEISVLVDQTICYTRDLTGRISPPVLYELGLDEALDWLAEHFGERFDLKVRYRSKGRESELGEATQIMLFNSAQELLRNVQRHSGARKAELTLAWSGDQVSVTVSDRGSGFDTSVNPRGGGFGLFSIRERMEQLGGSLELDSTPGKGSTVRLSAPCEEAS